MIARPPSKFYEFQKTVRRHWFGFAAVTTLIALLAAGVVVSTSELVRARRAEQEQIRLRRQLEVRMTISQAITLSNSRKYDEAEKLLNGIESSLVEPDAKADLYRQLAWQKVLQNQWSGVVTNLVLLMQVDGSARGREKASYEGFYATALVEAGDQAGYDQFRQALVKRFRGTHPKGADFFCLLALLTPADEQFMADLGPLGDSAAEPQEYSGDRKEDDMSANYIHRALFDYREGNYAGADELIQHCKNRLMDPSIVPTASAIRAMIHHQMHRDDEARKELASARQSIDPVIKTGPSAFDARKWDQQGRYYEWITASIFLSEATALIEGPTNAPAVDAKAQAN